MAKTVPSLKGAANRDVLTWLFNQAQDLRRSNNTQHLDRLNRMMPRTAGYRFTFNKTLQERPINLLVGKDALKAVASCWFEIAVRETTSPLGYSWELLRYDPDRPLPFGLTQTPFRAIFECKRRWTFVVEDVFRA